MMMPKVNKQGAELSLNVIVIAVLILIVLVVVVIIFSTKFNVFGRTTADCTTQGGYCNSDRILDSVGNRACPSGEVEIKNTNCAEPAICCINVFNSNPS